MLLSYPGWPPTCGPASASCGAVCVCLPHPPLLGHNDHSPRSHLPVGSVLRPAHQVILLLCEHHREHLCKPGCKAAASSPGMPVFFFYTKIHSLKQLERTANPCLTKSFVTKSYTLYTLHVPHCGAGVEPSAGPCRRQASAHPVSPSPPAVCLMRPRLCCPTLQWPLGRPLIGQQQLFSSSTTVLRLACCCGPHDCSHSGQPGVVHSLIKHFFFGFFVSAFHFGQLYCCAFELIHPSFCKSICC